MIHQQQHSTPTTLATIMSQSTLDLWHKRLANTSLSVVKKVCLNLKFFFSNNAASLSLCISCETKSHKLYFFSLRIAYANILLPGYTL